MNGRTLFMSPAWAAVAVTALALAGCSGPSTSSSRSGSGSDSNLLQDAYEACSTGEAVDWKAYGSQAPDADEVIQLSEDGNTVSLKTPRTQGEDLGNLSYTVGRCILREAEAPKSVGQAMVRANLRTSFDLHEEEWLVDLGAPIQVEFEWYDHTTPKGTAWDATFEATPAD